MTPQQVEPRWNAAVDPLPERDICSIWLSDGEHQIVPGSYSVEICIDGRYGFPGTFVSFTEITITGASATEIRRSRHVRVPAQAIQGIAGPASTPR